MSTFQPGSVSWYRTPIDPDVLARLMQRSNWRGALQTGCHLGLFFTTGAFAWFVYTQVTLQNAIWSVPALMLALFVHGTIGPFMGLIAIHELQHRTVFASRAPNEFFEKVYAFISWSDYLWYQRSHALHHRATCHRAHDGEVVLPLRFSLSKPGVWLGLLAWNPRNTWARLTMTWRHARGDVRGEWYAYCLDDPEIRRRHRNWARTLLIGHGLIAGAFLITGNWFGIVVFTLGTQYCGWLGFLCGVTQHYGLTSDVPDFRYNTRTFTCSWLPAFYYWNMQYHLEHHMFPAVPFHALPKLRATIEHDLPAATHGLRATWQHMLAVRQAALADPDYVYQPDVPVPNKA